MLRGDEKRVPWVPGSSLSCRIDFSVAKFNRRDDEFSTLASTIKNICVEIILLLHRERKRERNELIPNDD